MGSKANLSDIQRLLSHLSRELGSKGPGGGRKGKGQGKGPGPSENWDCPHCAEGIDNFANRARCFKCGGNRPKDLGARVERPRQAPRARSRPAKDSPPVVAPSPGPKTVTMEVEDPQAEAASELATARSLHEWARKLPQPARDRELPAAKKRLEQAEGEDKKRKPPAERLQSALSRVDHRQRQAQAARDALEEAKREITALEAECLHQDTLLAKDQEELQVAQSLHQAWGPTAREGDGAQTQPNLPQQGPRKVEVSEHQRDLLNRLYEALPAGTGPELLKELAGSLGFPPAQESGQEATAVRPVADPDPAEGSGPKKSTKQTRIKSQGPYARPGDAPGGSASRSASAQAAQEDTPPRGPQDREPEGGDPDQL